VDFSKFRTSDWLMVGGGAAMLILGFVLPWTTVSFAGISDSGDGPFDYFFPGGIAWLLIVAVGVLALLGAIGNLPDTQPWPLILLGLSGLGTLLMLIQILMGPRFDQPGFSRGIGMWLAVVWAVIATVGAVMSFQAGGGTMKDLTDMEKLKSSFGDKDRDGTPPPPPPPPPPAD